MKRYKVMTQKDRFFSGRFDPERLEDAINAYADQGWHVMGIATATIGTAIGGHRDEILVLMEREASEAEILAVKAASTTAPIQNSAARGTTAEYELARLDSLRKQGIVSDTEFERRRQELLAEQGKR